MESQREQSANVLRQIAPRNLLSFGPDTEPLPLANLNVLIGPNGAGKSNLLEAIVLMRAAPGDIPGIVRRGGGVRDWIWKGAKQATASIDLIIHNPKGRQPLRHIIAFRENEQRFRLDDERIENEAADDNESGPCFYYHFKHGNPTINLNFPSRGKRKLAHETVDVGRSILSQFREPEMYPEFSYLADIYETIRIYREWAFGCATVFRESQKADMRNDRLEEDLSNLGLFLNGSTHIGLDNCGSKDR